MNYYKIDEETHKDRYYPRIGDKVFCKSYSGHEVYRPYVEEDLEKFKNIGVIDYINHIDSILVKFKSYRYVRYWYFKHYELEKYYD